MESNEIKMAKDRAGYSRPVYWYCCRTCDNCVSLKRNLKCVSHGFLVAADGLCREGWRPRPGDSMMQQLFGGDRP